MNQIDWTVPHDHPAFAGHFPHMPVLPGVVLLDTALHAMINANQLDGANYQINSVKFLSPVQPGETLMINHSTSNQGTLTFNISASDRKVATGKIIPKIRQASGSIST
ncbi:MAG: 3-hydroxyacyl-ACP dehydratase FabZ family protein [Methylophilaceae bacterium]